MRRKLSPGTKPAIDIEHVHYVDPLGEKALHWLNRLKAGFVAQNAYGAYLCERRQLRRLTASESETHVQKGGSKEASRSSLVGTRQRSSSKEEARL